MKQKLVAVLKWILSKLKNPVVRSAIIKLLAKLV